jgi:fermentation-respiration switch protein FrsA (DUF1100 family)
MNKVTVAAFISIIVLTTSCAYNNKFLRPTKYTANTKKITINRTLKDSTVAVYNGSPYQPVFLKNGVDTVDISYTIESVMFTNRVGNKLNGWMLKSRTVVPTHTLLHFHGNTGSILGQFSAIKPLLNQGFQIFVFDYSGFGFSEGNVTRKNLLTDGVDAVAYLKTREDVKNKKLLLYGQSYGGHLSVCVAAKTQNNIDGLIVEGGFSNHKDLSAQGAKPFVAFMSRIFVKEIYAATKQVKQYKKPLLIIHSTDDKVIPFTMGKKVYEKANAPKEFFEVKGEHLTAPTLYTEQIGNKIKKMVE